MKVVPLTLRQANDFVEAHHRHSSRTSNDGGKFAIGLELAAAHALQSATGRLFPGEPPRAAEERG